MAWVHGKRMAHLSPFNIFVTGFVGSPAVNFLPGVRAVCYDGGATVLLEGIGQVVVPEHYVKRAKQVENLNLTFGIHPTHLCSNSPALDAQGVTRRRFDQHGAFTQEAGRTPGSC